MRTLVLADLHLTRASPARVGCDFAALIRAHPGARIIVAGDLLDRSADLASPGIDDAIAVHPGARAALGEHLTRGGSLWVASGNHDAELRSEAAAEELARGLRLDTKARGRLVTSPWFFRDGGLHLEIEGLPDAPRAVRRYWR